MSQPVSAQQIHPTANVRHGVSPAAKPQGWSVRPTTASEHSIHCRTTSSPNCATTPRPSNCISATDATARQTPQVPSPPPALLATAPNDSRTLLEGSQFHRYAWQFSPPSQQHTDSLPPWKNRKKFPSHGLQCKPRRTIPVSPCPPVLATFHGHVRQQLPHLPCAFAPGPKLPSPVNPAIGYVVTLHPLPLFRCPIIS